MITKTKLIHCLDCDYWGSKELYEEGDCCFMCKSKSKNIEEKEI